MFMLVHVYVEVCTHVCMEASGHYQVSFSTSLFCFVLVWLGFEQGLPLNLVLTKISELAASEPQVLPVS